MANYTIELGVDLEARQIQRTTPGVFYLASGITKDTAPSTYVQFRVGDQIAFRIFNITCLGSGPDQTFDAVSLTLCFENAREQEHDSPVLGPNLTTKRLQGPNATHSVIFNRSLPSYTSEWSGSETLRLENPGFFLASYQLTVKTVAGETRVYRHDPEWIIDNDGEVQLSLAS